MSTNAVTHLPIPKSATLVVVAKLKIHKSCGSINAMALNKPEFDKQQTIKAGNVVILQFQQKLAGVWTDLGSAVTLQPGASQPLSFRTANATEVRIQGRSATGSATVRLDLQHNGKPFHGQIDLPLREPQKAGYTTLGDTTAGTAADPSPSNWE